MLALSTCDPALLVHEQGLRSKFHSYSGYNLRTTPKKQMAGILPCALCNERPDTPFRNT